MHSTIKNWVKNTAVPNIIEAYRNGNVDRDGIKDRNSVTMKNVFNTVKKSTDITINLKNKKTVEIYKIHEKDRKKVNNKTSKAAHMVSRSAEYVLYRLYDNDILVNVLNGLQESKLNAKYFKNFMNERTRSYGKISFDTIFDKTVLNKKRKR